MSEKNADFDATDIDITHTYLNGTTVIRRVELRKDLLRREYNGRHSIIEHYAETCLKDMKLLPIDPAPYRDVLPYYLARIEYSYFKDFLSNITDKGKQRVLMGQMVLDKVYSYVEGDAFYYPKVCRKEGMQDKTDIPIPYRLLFIEDCDRHIPQTHTYPELSSVFAQKYIEGQRFHREQSRVAYHELDMVGEKLHSFESSFHSLFKYIYRGELSDFKSLRIAFN